MLIHSVPGLVQAQQTDGLINFNSKVNAMTPTLTAIVSFSTQVTGIGYEKIHSYTLNM